MLRSGRINELDNLKDTTSFSIIRIIKAFCHSHNFIVNIYLSTDPSLNLAPLVSWMALGTIFSTFSGRPSWSA
jgi:hypothetical protein